MSILFAAGSTEYIEVASSPLSAYPISISLWFKATDNNPSGEQVLFYWGDDTTGDSYIIFNINSSGFVRFWDRSANNQIINAVDVCDGAWHHLLGVLYYSGANRASFYVDGTAITENQAGTADSVSAFNRVAVGMARDLTPGGAYSGEIQEVGIWNIQLDNDDAISLAANWSPELVRQNGLKFYLPLLDDEHQDLIGGLSFSEGGTPEISDHHSMIYPSNVYSDIPSVGAPPSGNAPTGTIYGPLFGPFGGPI